MHHGWLVMHILSLWYQTLHSPTLYLQQTHDDRVNETQVSRDVPVVEQSINFSLFFN